MFDVELRVYNLLPEAWAEARDRYAGPTRVLVRESTSFNCAGLAFASRRGWVTGDSPDRLEGPEGFAPDHHEVIVQLLRHDKYTQRPGLDGEAGDLAVYARNGKFEHIGLLIGCRHELRKEPMVVSKFGEFGEYLHALSDVPTTLGTPNSVWTLSEMTP
jgi:hypothetical protein